MTPEQLRLVAGSRQAALADADRFATVFYDRLFEVAPETRALFPTDLTEQKGKIVAELAFLAEAVEDLDTFRAEARHLGARHHRYGVRPGDFPAVERALLDALGTVLGSTWTPAHEAAWRRLFLLIAEVMLEGVNEQLFQTAD